MAERLPDPVQERIVSFPEYTMGAHKVALDLRDGSVVEGVLVAWGEEVARVGGETDWQFDVADVIDAHDRSSGEPECCHKEREF